MRIINGKKKYIAHCYEINTGEKTSVYWSMKGFEFAEHLCRMGGLTIIENLGYIYDFNQLKKAMEKFGSNPYWKNIN